MLLSIENLTVRYGADTALSIDSPIQIEEGDRVGVIGSNGAGKTTLLKAILGLVPYQGVIRTGLRPEEMAVHMQFNEYTDAMPVRHIMEAVLGTRIARDRKLQELIAFFEFGDCLRKKYSKLSGGQKQRFTIIMVMMQEAALTFYDEVTSGLDFETRQRLVEKLVEWYRGKRESFLMVSHYYEELDQLAQKLLILDKGLVLDYGPKEELWQGGDCSEPLRGERKAAVRLPQAGGSGPSYSLVLRERGDGAEDYGSSSGERCQLQAEQQ